ncbi:TetR/AcrR family transcriptional regulator [Sanguibacter massiliensis]|uniref:TetR/AcrR family transcriptional regulator n=1 Tax=Sanguibacter massiliensis TaxID=1973217 RepID=UPI0013EBB37F|nr:TetR/AcrR family transcriptional regulator [Sanguibacter massiliensis]
MTTGAGVDDNQGVGTPVEDTFADAIATSPRRARTRERLLDAALTLFAEVGVDATSIEAICERAGFTRGAFYSNFSDRSALIDALAAREQGRAISELRDAIEASPWNDVPDGTDDVGVVASVATQLLDALTIDRRWALVNGEMRLMALRDRSLAPAHEARENLLLDAIADEIRRLTACLGRRLAIPDRTFVRLLWAGFQADLEAADRSLGTDRPTTAVELATSWIPEVVTRLTVPVEPGH